LMFFPRKVSVCEWHIGHMTSKLTSR